jgi:hypothetical protein
LLFEKIESENPSPEHSRSFPGNQENSSLARTGLLFRCGAKLNADTHSEFPRALRALDDPADPTTLATTSSYRAAASSRILNECVADKSTAT